MDIISDVLAELCTSTFYLMVEKNGKANTLSAIKPYRIDHSKYIVEEARKVLNLQGNGPDVMLTMHAFASSTIIPDVTGELKEKGAVGINRGCLFKDSTPEFCMYISHFTTKAITDFVNPEYEDIWTHHETSGDEYCRYIFKKRSDPISVMDDLGPTLAKLPRFEIPPNQARAMRAWALAAFWSEIVSAFVDLNGAETASEILRLNSQKIGIKTGKKLKKRYGDFGNDVDALCKLFNSISISLNRKGILNLDIPNEFSKEITDCPWQIFDTYHCVQWHSFLRGMLESVNPKYEFACDRMMTKGDKTCHWTIRKKGKLANEKTMEEAVKQSGETALELLKKRLAKYLPESASKTIFPGLHRTNINSEASCVKTGGKESFSPLFDKLTLIEKWMNRDIIEKTYKQIIENNDSSAARKLQSIQTLAYRLPTDVESS